MAGPYAHSGDAQDAHLVGDLTASGLSLTIDSYSGWPTPGTNQKSWIAIDPDTVNEEHILFNTRSNGSLTIASAADRGLEGTTAIAHSSGAIVRHIFSATEADQIGAYHGIACSLSVTTVTLVTATISTVSWDTEAYDTDGYHSVSVNTSRLTVPTGLAGKYRVWGVAEFAASATGHRSMDVQVNGATVHSLAAAPAGLSSDAVPTLNGSISLALAVGDYVELRLYQDSGGNLGFNANGQSRFGMDFLGY